MTDLREKIASDIEQESRVDINASVYNAEEVADAILSTIRESIRESIPPLEWWGSHVSAYIQAGVYSIRIPSVKCDDELKHSLQFGNEFLGHYDSEDDAVSAADQHNAATLLRAMGIEEQDK